MDARLRVALENAQAGKLQTALGAINRIIAAEPYNTDALQILGLISSQIGDHQKAILALEKAVKIAPRIPAYQNNLGNALLSQMEFKRAEEHFLAAVLLDPNYHLSWLGLGISRAAQSKSSESLSALRQAKALRPSWPELDHQYANVLEAADRVDEAIALLKHSTETYPISQVLHSRYLMLLNYIDLPSEVVIQEHVKHKVFYQQKSLRDIALAVEPPFRLGILSGDLRLHSVGYFAMSLFAKKPSDFQLFVYSISTRNPDDLFEREFHKCVKQWNEVAVLNDLALDEKIRGDQLHLLLELSGHTANNRLAALGNAPTDKIMHAIGYPNSIGHPAIGYRLGDSITDPSDDQKHSLEQVVRVDPCFLCYYPFPDAPTPSMPLDDEPPTFGCFNLSSKISISTMKLWAEILEVVHGANLVLKSRFLKSPDTCRHLIKRLVNAGVPAERVTILNYTHSIREHLEQYQRMHVSLDTFPYNGTTTTCESLWMGVPVVTLAGDRHASRVGASLLNAAGIPELVAKTRKEYVSIASEWISDRSRLAHFRQESRQKLSQSALMDQDRYAAGFYSALRKLLISEKQDVQDFTG